MVKLNLKDDFFEFVKNNPGRKVIVYGVGQETQKNYEYMGHIDFYCDQRAKEIGLIRDIPCLLPEELIQFHEKLIILICIKRREIAEQVYEELKQLQIEADIFLFFDNPAFSHYIALPYLYVSNPKERLRIRIINQNDGWILNKFASKLQEELCKLGQEADIADKEDITADVNHYVCFDSLHRIYNRFATVRTTMVTHVNSVLVKDMIQYQAQNNVVGICMSADTQNNLVSWGIPRDKICYINPAQDGEIKPRKIVLGITNRCHYEDDLRKRDELIILICQQLDARFFKLKIMGEGWEQIVRQLQKMGFEVDYYDKFNRDIYKELMPSLDYWIFYGFDEGGMGYLDALAAGVKTIATPQGYHLDTACGLTFPCSTVDDFARTLKKIQREKEEIISSVKDWTWENYARKHLEIWQYLTRSRTLKEVYAHQGEYMDGIFSLLVCDIRG